MKKRFYYHVSPAFNSPAISDEGLRVDQEPNHWSADEPKSRRIHFSAGIKDAHKWGEQIEATFGDNTPMSMFKVDLRDLPVSSRSTDIGLTEHTVGANVDPSRISHVYDFMPGDSFTGRRIRKL